MLPQGLEEGMGRVSPIPGGLMIVIDGEKGVQRDASELLAFANDIYDGLIPVGLEILDLQATNLILSQPCGQKGEQDGVKQIF